MNQLQALPMNEGQRWKTKLWSQQGRTKFEKLPLAPWASRRRQELLESLDRMNPTIDQLTAAVEQEGKRRPEVLRLITHPGVGPPTALAYVLIIGTPMRFPCGKQIGTYLGMIPSEDSSAGKQRLGHISRQGNSLLRFLLVEAAQVAVRHDPDWRRRYLHLAFRRVSWSRKRGRTRDLWLSDYESADEPVAWRISSVRAGYAACACEKARYSSSDRAGSNTQSV